MDGIHNASPAGLLGGVVAPVISQPASISLIWSIFASFQKGSTGDEDGNARWSSFIGIVTAICGNIIISFALNIQRYAHIRIDREWERERVRLGSRRISRRGTPGRASLCSYGTVDDVGENDLREQTNGDIPTAAVQDQEHHADVDPRGGLQQSFHSDRTLGPVDSDSNNGDRMNYLRSPYWWCGIVLMTVGEAGNFLAYGFAPASIVSPLGVVALVSNCVIAPFMLKERFRKRDFWGVAVAVTGAVVVVLSANTSEVKIGPHDLWVMITRWEFELYLGLSAALIVALMMISDKYGGKTILIDVGLVGLFGGYTALSTKGVASLLSFTLWHVITYPVTYLLVAILVSSALLQIRYINRALRHFDSTQVIPTQFVMFTLSVIIGSAVLYRDFESTTASQAAKFVGGCFMTFLGVYLITSGRVRTEDEYSEGDEEDAIGLLAEDRYQTSLDLSHPGPDLLGYNPGQTNTEQEDILHSPRGSLLSDSENSNDNLRTPKGVLSPALSFRGGSVSTRSISPPLQDFHSSSAHSQPLLANPWAGSHDSLAQIETEERLPDPSTPPRQFNRVQSTPSVLLRFPAAPGMTESTPPRVEVSNGMSPPSPSKVDTTRSEPQHLVSSRTPQSSSRNSLSLRLRPSPLLPPLSSGLSAVIADSLRRVEGSTGHRRSRKGERRRKSAAAFPGSAHHEADIVGGDIGYDTETSIGDDQGHSHEADASTPASSRFNSTGTLPNSTADGANDLHGDRSKSRLRSLSDPRNDKLAWLSRTFRRPRKKRSRDASNSSTSGHV